MNAVTGGVKTILRLEGLCVLLVSLLAFHIKSGEWLTFLILFFIPDLALLGYLINAKVGAVLYNITHSYIGALILLGAGLLLEESQYIAIAFIWTGHIGFDRMFGFGLKYSSGFKFTHLGGIGVEKNKKYNLLDC